MFADQASDQTIDLSRAPLLTHLLELRRRLLYCLGLFALIFVVCYFLSDSIYAFLLQPLKEVFDGDENRHMIYTGLHEAFLTYLKLSFFSALFFSLPVILIQIFKFIAPGLYQNESRSIRVLFFLTPVLFVAGAALAFYVVFPLAWRFFLGFESTSFETGIAIQLEARVTEYLDLVIRLILAFGLSFELPVVLFLLAKIGVVSAAGLAANRRYAIVIAYAVAAILTPPDFISQMALGTPILLLYEISIIVIRLSEKSSGFLNPDKGLACKYKVK